MGRGCFSEKTAGTADTFIQSGTLISFQYGFPPARLSAAARLLTFGNVSRRHTYFLRHVYLIVESTYS